VKVYARYSFEISDRKPELSMSNHMAVVVLHYGLSFGSKHMAVV